MLMINIHIAIVKINHTVIFFHVFVVVSACDVHLEIRRRADSARVELVARDRVWKSVRRTHQRRVR